MRIGIDVGGTNTDGVLIDNSNNVVNSFKTNTSDDVNTAVKLCIEKLINNVDKKNIDLIIIGTTHLINDLIQRKNLSKTGVIRLCGPSTKLLKPLSDWPKELINKNLFISHFAGGGLEFDGREISPVIESEIKKICETFKSNNVESVAINGVFASVDPYQEIHTSKIISEQMGDIPISLSHQIGRIGLLERENATILNSMLIKSAKRTFANLNKIIKELKLDSEIYITQNDGTMSSVSDAIKYPIFSLSSGPTNSMRGASFLSGIDNGLVVDIGGTSTDIGMLINSFPKESSIAVDFSGIRTNFRMADVLSIPLGGGTMINNTAPFISELSVGNEITSKSLSFGGNITTVTDIYASESKINFSTPNKKIQINKNIISGVKQEIKEKISIAIDRMKTSSNDINTVIVGGGTFVMPDNIKGINLIEIPKHSEVANAIGSAFAQVSGYSEKVFATGNMTREEILLSSKNEAIKNAISKGADKNTIEIIDVEEIPLAYLPSNAITVKTRVVGNIKTI